MFLCSKAFKGHMTNKITKLAEKRTFLAQVRTVLAYFRTAAALILFGLAFLGFREEGVIFWYGGWAALGVGLFFLTIAVVRGVRSKQKW